MFVAFLVGLRARRGARGQEERWEFAVPAKWGNALGNALRGAGAKFGFGRRHSKNTRLGAGLGPDAVTRPNGKPLGRSCLRTGDASNANWANFLRQELEGVQLFRHRTPSN